MNNILGVQCCGTRDFIWKLYMLICWLYLICRTQTMHRPLCLKSNFLNHFVFTLGCYLFPLSLVQLRDERIGWVVFSYESTNKIILHDGILGWTCVEYHTLLKASFGYRYSKHPWTSTSKLDNYSNLEKSFCSDCVMREQSLCHWNFYLQDQNIEQANNFWGTS